MITTVLIVLMWLLCVLLSLAIIFETTLGTLTDWFYRAYAKSPAAQTFNDTVRLVTHTVCHDAASRRLLLTPPPTRRSDDRLDDLEGVYKVTNAPATHRLILESIREHVAAKCNTCALRSVIRVDRTHYGNIYQLFNRDVVASIELLYLAPQSSLTRIPQGAVAFNTPLRIADTEETAVAPEPSSSITIQDQIVRLSSTSLIPASMNASYKNTTGYHVVVLRVLIKSK